ncbi:ATP-binding domain-containing protein [Savagea sp. SN6]|uniref:ATP-binding domain-containing protein n=1 Tax=Savagea serpentis TaxID=2785297 RepID=A0A8J7GIJ0_9BACL|nr:3'-5' exonuclease [Savagea serpentis]MBF4500465.1 ATP-binding domain-containing protein [Savagea serpentis]
MRKLGDVLKSGVKIVTMHGAKGLEFDVVIVTELNKRFPMMWGVVEGEEENRVETDRRLLYVSMTRARGRLYIVYDGEPSRYIEELDKALYEYIEM